jgi:hypothetical protein
LPGSTTAFAHFDNCTFSDSSFGIRQEIETAVERAANNDIAPFSCPTTDVVFSTPPRPACHVPAADNEGLDDFAHALHTVQDFYSHTNWVERSSSELFFDKLGPFPVLFPSETTQESHDLFIAEQDPLLFPGSLFVSPGNPNTLSYPQRVEPDARIQGQQVPALISGDTTQGPVAERTFPGRCPQINGRGQPYTVTHAELAKDDRNEHAQQFASAFLAARFQTTHEWCRLLDRVYSRFGPSGVAHVCEQWVEDPQEANAACPSLAHEAQCPFRFDDTFSPQKAGWSFQSPSADYLGQLNDNVNVASVTLTLNAPSGPGMLEFDLLTFRTLDNASTCCTDTLTMTVNGMNAFSYGPGGPDAFATNPSGATIGIASFLPPDAGTREISVPITLLQGANTFTWSYSPLQSFEDEAWGLDNVRVHAP